MLLDFTTTQIFVVCLLFVWTGFVRTGLGFGGAALGLPLMLFVKPDLLLWLPMIGTHLLFFSGLTLTHLSNSMIIFSFKTVVYVFLTVIMALQL